MQGPKIGGVQESVYVCVVTRPQVRHPGNRNWTSYRVGDKPVGVSVGVLGSPWAGPPTLGPIEPPVLWLLRIFPRLWPEGDRTFI